MEKKKITSMPKGGNPIPEEPYEDSYQIGTAGERDVRYILSKKLFTKKDADITYRTLNHWTEIGLLDDEREEHTETWRRLSVLELVWIKILKELREFGLSLEKLLVTKSTLIDDVFTSRMFEFAIGACINFMPSFVVVNRLGEAEVRIDKDLEDWDNLETYPDLVRINLNRIWYEITGEDPKPYYRNVREKRKYLSEQEREVINAVRQGHHKITVTKAKSSWLIDSTKNIQGVAQVAELLRDMNFGKIVLKVEHGKTVASEVTKRKKK